MKRINLLIFVFTLGLTIDVTNAQITYGETMKPSEDVAAHVDAYLNDLVDQGEFSGSVLVAKNGQVIISKGYGFASIELNVPNTLLTKFRLGSITKQFTALAIMMLQERELLSVYDPISLYVPDCPEAWQAITIHHLLTHTSGIKNFTDLPEWVDYARVPHTIEETIDLFRDWPLQFTPGEKYEYCNSGYILLGMIIEVTSGKSYEGFIIQNIFNPLGMCNSGYDSTQRLIMDRADGYTHENDNLVNAVHIEMETPYAAGALYSTVEDLFLWDQSLYTTALVSQDTIDTIFTSHTTTTSTEQGYGYGWFLNEIVERQLIWHDGAINGFRTFIGRFPQEGIIMIVLSNFQFTPIYDIAGDLADIVKDIFDPMLIAHWKFDETEGMFAVDSAGDNDAIVLGGIEWQPTGGQIDGALQLDGVSGYAITGAVLNPADGPFSVLAWIKGQAQGQVIVSQQNDANWLAIDAEGNLMTELKGVGRSTGPLLSEAVITDGQWHRIGLVWDGSNITLCVDGVVVAEDTRGGLQGSENGLNIGAGKMTEPGAYWSGLIDDVRIYDKAMTIEQISELSR